LEFTYFEHVTVPVMVTSFGADCGEDAAATIGDNARTPASVMNESAILLIMVSPLGFAPI
jgi:hypothetical protein